MVFFSFEDITIDEIMNQIKRWYDVEVEYIGGRPSGHFAGEISRNTNLLTVLELLKRSGVKANINNKKIIITNVE